MRNENPPPKRRAWQTDREWNRLRERIDAAEVQGPPRRSPMMAGARWVGVAAGVVGVTLALRIGWRATHPEPAVTRTATTAAGERLVIHLADSSVVTLGPSSTLRYTLAKRSRNLELVGLGNFKVVHDSTRPFVVRAKNAITTDVGTEFSIRAYPSDTSVDVAVTAGVVALSSPTSTTAIELKQGDLGFVAAGGIPARVSTRHAATATAWVDGRLVFNDEPLSSVAAELSRWFDVDIRIASDALAARRVSGIYNNPSLSGVLEALTATLGARYDRAGRTITVSPDSRIR